MRQSGQPCTSLLVYATVMLFELSVRCQTHRTSPCVIPPGTMSAGKCRLIINELNVHPNGQQQFIELKKICETNLEKNYGINGLEKYKVLIVGNDGFLTVACQLRGGGRRSNNEFFYVLGGDEVDGRSMSISDCHFATDSDDSRDLRLPTGNHYPVGVMLVYNKRSSIIDQLDLDNEGGIENPSWKKVKISSGGRIMENLQDMVIVTSSSPYTRCPYFDMFYTGIHQGGKSILRDWGQTTDSDVALSRCQREELGIQQFYPFQPLMFAIAKKTPGEDNDCAHSTQFTIEDYQPARKRPRTDLAPTPGHECDVTTEDPFIDTLGMITSPLSYASKLQEALQQAQVCEENEPAAQLPPINENVEHEPSTTSTTASPDSDEEFRIDGTQMVFNPTQIPQQMFEEEMAAASLVSWPDCTNFQPANLIEKLKRPGQQLLDWRDILRVDTCNWFEYLGWTRSSPTIKSPKFRCKICHKLLSQGILIDRPKSKWITKLMKEGQGVGGACAKSDNKRIVKIHRDNPLHNIGISYLKLLEEGLRGEDLREKFMEPGGLYQAFLKSTENLFTATYQAVRLDITFYKFSIFRELLDYLGVNTGHLYSNAPGMKLITTSISDTMHKNFLKYLKNEEPECALLVDLSTDISTLPAAAFVFQTLDKKGKLRLSLYRVLHMPGETAEEIFDTFIKEIRKDGLEQYIIHKLVGYASDSGSNVLKFRELLQNKVDHKLMETKCQAHRLENAHKSAWKSEAFLLHVDHVVNDVYRIFHRSAKKKRVLVLQQDIMGDSAFEVKKYHKIRWVASKKRALESLLTHWKTIVAALDEISIDKSFEKDQQNDAIKTSGDLKNPSFIATLAFAVDIFDIMSPYSLGLQYRGTTLIGKKLTREVVLSKLDNLRRDDGKYLREILDNAKPISQDAPPRAISLREFETEEMSLYEVELTCPVAPDSESESSSLYIKRDEYIDKLVREIRNRFPEDPSDGYDIFDPQLWPEEIEDLKLYGDTRLRRMNRKLLWNYHSEALLPAWRDLKIRISQHPQFNRQKSSLPEDFWGFFLATESGIEWPESLKTIITNIVTVPASTAEVERIFSFYTSIKTVKRFSLDVSTVDSIIRLKFNGPKDIKDFKAIDYLPDFLKEHARSDDELIPATKKKRGYSENQDLEESGDQNDEMLET